MFVIEVLFVEGVCRELLDCVLCVVCGFFLLWPGERHHLYVRYFSEKSLDQSLDQSRDLPMTVPELRLNTDEEFLVGLAQRQARLSDVVGEKEKLLCSSSSQAYPSLSFCERE